MNDDTSERGFGVVGEREAPPEDNAEAETEDEHVESESNEGQETNTEEADNQQDSEENNDQNEEEDSQKQTQEEGDGEKRTEKGTKLDPNPKSAVHQQLANERRVRGQMEKVLGDPALLAQFVKKQYGIDMPNPKAGEKNGQTEEAKIELKQYTAKDFESLDDVAKKFNEMQNYFVNLLKRKEEEIGKIKNAVGGMQNTSRMNQIADRTTSEVNSLRTVPELDPKSPDFIDGLEGQIASLYHTLDFDPESETYRGQYSIAEIGKLLVNTARQARKAGVQRGQTIIKDKTGGKIRTGGTSKGAVDREEMSAGASIASGIASMFKK